MKLFVLITFFVFSINNIGFSRPQIPDTVNLDLKFNVYIDRFDELKKFKSTSNTQNIAKKQILKPEGAAESLTQLSE